MPLSQTTPGPRRASSPCPSTPITSSSRKFPKTGMPFRPQPAHASSQRSTSRTTSAILTCSFTATRNHSRWPSPTRPATAKPLISPTQVRPTCFSCGSSCSTTRATPTRCHSTSPVARYHRRLPRSAASGPRMALSISVSATRRALPTTASSMVRQATARLPVTGTGMALTRSAFSATAPFSSKTAIRRALPTCRSRTAARGTFPWPATGMAMGWIPSASIATEHSSCAIPTAPGVPTSW